MKKLLGTLSAIAALMTAIAFIGCKQPEPEDSGTLPYEGYYTATDDYVQILTAEAFADATFTEVKVALANIEWNGTGYRWFNVFTGVNGDNWENVNKIIDYDYSEDTEDVSEKSITIDDASFIAAVKQKGLYIAGTSGLTCTISVEVKNNPINEEDLETKKLYDAKDYTADGNPILILESSDFEDYDIIKVITVEIEGINWPDNPKDGWLWINICSSTGYDNKQAPIDHAVGDDDDETETTVTIRNETVIAAIKENGLYIAGTPDFTCKVTVSVSYESSAD